MTGWLTPRPGLVPAPARAPAPSPPLLPLSAVPHLAGPPLRPRASSPEETCYRLSGRSCHQAVECFLEFISQGAVGPGRGLGTGTVRGRKGKVMGGAGRALLLEHSPGSWLSLLSGLSLPPVPLWSDPPPPSSWNHPLLPHLLVPPCPEPAVAPHSPRGEARFFSDSQGSFLPSSHGGTQFLQRHFSHFWVPAAWP